MQRGFFFEKLLGENYCLILVLFKACGLSYEFIIHRVSFRIIKIVGKKLWSGMFRQTVLYVLLNEKKNKKPLG